jgi:ankyrin repeat protein
MKRVFLLAIVISVLMSSAAFCGSCDLMRAVAAGDLDSVQKIVASGQDINEKCSQKTSLMVACTMTVSPAGDKKKQIEIIEFLLSKGADPNPVDALNKTALMQVIENPFPTPHMIRVLTLLLGAGSDVNVPDHRGNTAIKKGLAYPDKQVSDLFYKSLAKKEEPLEETK